MKRKNDSTKSKIHDRKLEMELLKQAKNGSKEARDKLVEINQGLVFSIAKKYAFLQNNLADLVAEGNMGLLKAIEKYDLKKRAKFGTYAYFWVKKYIMKAVMDQSITAPENVQKLKTKYKNALEKFRTEKNRYPKDSEIASILKVNPKTFSRYRNYFESIKIPELIRGDADQYIDMFEVKNNEEDEIRWTKLLRDEDLLNTLFERIKKKHKKILIEKRIQALKLRYGIEDGTTYSCNEIAKKMQISRQRVHQMIKTCIKYLHQEIKEMKNEGII
ncbi:MAG TPA: sigma-70 family RNA polymerase sigma factor [Candidatus Ratteibacteria bacterium]|nr:sigma-70 family RNA polymerase sigma factor [bacterium]HRS05648.1 sigma-70 family RNA polymerase sigma factor [Candidatus Ratteibacteria bacterium]HON05335.1 sigma-70 family RNA polymerase sigma factor [bacterium]HPC28825.1 sigma-70 family RNA polymerase sigma factor [bacterium]HQL64399.1 sigma-70 family RNA polymerase sigma factor [bacterium]